MQVQAGTDEEDQHLRKLQATSNPVKRKLMVTYSCTYCIGTRTAPTLNY